MMVRIASLPPSGGGGGGGGPVGSGGPQASPKAAPPGCSLPHLSQNTGATSSGSFHCARATETVPPDDPGLTLPRLARGPRVAEYLRAVVSRQSASVQASQADRHGTRSTIRPSESRISHKAKPFGCKQSRCVTAPCEVRMVIEASLLSATLRTIHGDRRPLRLIACGSISTMLEYASSTSFIRGRPSTPTKSFAPSPPSDLRRKSHLS